MKNQTSNRAIWLRTLILLPLLALLIYGFSTTQIVEKKAKATSEETIKATSKEFAKYNELAKHYNEEFAKEDSNRVVKLKDLTTMERIYKRMTTKQKANAQPFPECIPPPPPIAENATEFEKQKYETAVKAYEYASQEKSREKATPKQIKEYNKLAKKYNEMPKNNMWIDAKEVARMRHLYDLMTIKQRKNAEPFPSIPPPPPAPDAPKIADIPPPPPTGDKPNEFELAEVPPPPPPPDAQNEFVLADPPPPPPPPKVDVKEHLKKMNALGATFFYEDAEVTYNYVLDLVLFNKNLNIQTKTSDADPPVVYISKSFIHKKGDN